MNILIDVGNTRIKLGWLDARTGLREKHPLALEHGQLDGLDEWLSQCQETPSAAWGTSVAHSSVADAIDTLLQRRYGFSARWICPGRQAAGVLNAYRHPELLGADRWVSMLGLAPKAEFGPAMLANFGTATTVDTLAPLSASEGLPDLCDNSGAAFVFHGGLILPGPALMQSSLASNTARLPSATGPTARYPTDTQQAISSGIAAAQAGAVLRQWREGIRQFGSPPLVFAGGGGWPVVEAEVRQTLALAQKDLGLPLQPIQILSSPVLDGLARLVISASE